MTIPSCVRCGQVLLPEIVRELGDGHRCPFCGADLKPAARADMKKASLAPPPARATRSAAAATLPGLPAARAQTAAGVAVAASPPRSPQTASVAVAVAASPSRSPQTASVAVAVTPSPSRSPQTAPAAVAVAPSTPRSSPATAAALAPPPRLRANTAPTMAFAPAPQPDTTADLPSDPAPRLDEAERALGQRLDLAPLPSNAAPPWLAARRSRRWLAVPAVLGGLVAIGLVAGRRPTAVTRGSSGPAASVVPLPAAAPPSARPLPPAPPADDHEAIQGSGLAPSHPATGHADDRAGARAAHRTHHQKKHTARPSRREHKRVVALESVAAPQRAEDERSARASYERGNQRLLSGDTAAAISAYEEAVRSAPSSPSGYRGLGLAYEKEGKIAEAVGAFRKYLELAPSSTDRDLVGRRMRHLLRSRHPGK